MTDKWVIWKAKDTKWSPILQAAGYHQILKYDKKTRVPRGVHMGTTICQTPPAARHISQEGDHWGFKIKGWWRTGDIKATKPKKTFECWVNSAENTPDKAQKRIMTALKTPHQAFGKDEYIVNLQGHEQHY